MRCSNALYVGNELPRALMSSPELLLLDEPLADVDVERRRRILPYLERVRDQLAVPIVYVTHAAEVRLLADHVVVLDQGLVVRSGRRDLGWLRSRRRHHATRPVPTSTSDAGSGTSAAGENSGRTPTQSSGVLALVANRIWRGPLMVTDWMAPQTRISVLSTLVLTCDECK